MEKYSDQTSCHLLMFDIKVSPIKKLLKVNYLVKKLALKISYQAKLLFFGVAVKCIDISISDINYVTIGMVLIFNICSYKTCYYSNFNWCKSGFS